MAISIAAEFVVCANAIGEQTGSFVAMRADGTFVFTWTTVSQIDGFSRVAYRYFDHSLGATTSDGYVQSGLMGVYNLISAGVVGLEADLDRASAGILYKVSESDVATASALPGGLSIGYVGGLHQPVSDVFVEGGLVGPNPSSMIDFGMPFIVQVVHDGINGFDIGYSTLDGYHTSNGSFFPVNTTRSGDQVEPSAALSSAGIFFSWTSKLSADSEIRGRLLSGTSDFTVSTASGHSLSDSCVEALSNQNFAVSWLADEELSTTGIYLKFFDKNGNAVGIEKRVSADSTDDYLRPSLMSLNDGRILAVYGVHDFATGDYEIRGRMFEETGMRIGNEFLIGSAGNNPNVTFDLTRAYSPTDLLGAGPFTRNGKIIVTWDKNTGTETGVDIVATAIDPGTYTGTELADTWIGGRFADRIFGKSGADILLGKAAGDIISGGNGNDRIVGGNGVDKLTGGLGSDRFEYGSKLDCGDSIRDFGATDFFVFKNAGFSALDKGVLDADQFRLRAHDTKALDKNDHFIFCASNDTLWYDSNGSGKGGLTLIADLAKDFALKADDILII